MMREAEVIIVHETDREIRVDTTREMQFEFRWFIGRIVKNDRQMGVLEIDFNEHTTKHHHEPRLNQGKAEEAMNKSVF